ncbi:ABC transporter ATP-binding protein [Brevibacillus laterosporus]|uniref:ABC transporter ATP-binding protein n=1 Tax=Brevibacillus laterosporus TaxID=1465 RepID=UPI002157E33E|nr:ABC transporter ATP-binding protein [Brevibacillus laterosporus]MED1666976.1 ABC transporter ATP-binding protein [Brevibacillus laterosporus]MED1669927.1 ABC transporter ATP-binding protein [Brevibacillus laterosporus]MED1720075.1 ABC transporter ATP-binding protein [Brevibacillus laterosporus]
MFYSRHEKKEWGILFSLQCTKKVFPLIWKCTSFLMVATVSMAVIKAVIPLLQIYLTKTLINTTMDIINKNTNFVEGVFFLVLQMGLVVVGLLINNLDDLIRLRMSQRVSYYFDQLIIEKSSKLPLIFFENPENHNYLHRASAGIGARGLKMSFSTLDIVKNLITLIGYLYILVQLHWLLFVCILLLVFPPIIITTWLGKKQYTQARDFTSTNRLIFYLYRLLIERNTAKELRIFGHTKYLEEKWGNTYWKYEDSVYQLRKKSVSAELGKGGINSFAETAFIAVLLWFGSQGKLTIGDYVSLSQAITSAISLIQFIAFNLGQLYNETLYIKDFFDFMELEEEEQELAIDPTFSLKEGIRVENLSFSFPNRTEPALHNISFQINKGEKIAIVGTNGAGKSTLIKCLVGLYKVSEGNIYYDHHNINQVSVRHIISAIFQDFVTYNLTVKENIGIADVQNMNNKELLKNASVQTGADEVIHQLSKGYDTELGTSFAGGQDISGGQWQKIALSRALFKPAEVIILDEPTAALDPIAEAQLLEKFIEITDNKTAIFITHRLGSCKNVDRILVLKDGNLVEEGNHEELMQRNGEYAEMFRSQAQWYVEADYVTV